MNNGKIIQSPTPITEKTKNNMAVRDSLPLSNLTITPPPFFIMSYIPEGCILIARKVKESEIWSKPAWWYKVFTYIIMEVSYKNGQNKRGTGFFQYKEIFRECHLNKEKGLKPRTIENVIRWMKKVAICTAQKTTRGVYITLCNYDTYQNINNYKDGAEDGIGTEQERNRNGTITKESKESKESKEEDNNGQEQAPAPSAHRLFSSIIDYLNKQAKREYRPTTEKTKSLIRARLREGFTEQDFRTVIDKKVEEWLGDDKMDKYLRPSTLFGTKFEDYLNQKSEKKGYKKYLKED